MIGRPQGRKAMYRASLFSRFAKWAAYATGHPTSFVLAVGILCVWAIAGPLYHFSDTWQLVINTGTTIITFLMVFLIQNETVAKKLTYLRSCSGLVKTG